MPVAETDVGSITGLMVNNQTGLINELSTNQLVILVITFALNSELRTPMSDIGRSYIAA